MRIRDIAIGVGLAVLVLLGLQGFDVMPWVAAAGLFFAIRFLVLQRGSRFEVVSSNAGQGRNTPTIQFADIGGQDCAKQELMEALQFLQDSNKTAELGIRPLKGVLLAGPPGTGKTLLAKAAANFTDAVFLAASGSQFVEMYVGVGAQRVRQLFNNAAAQAREQNKTSAILFLDEIDVLGAARGQNSSHTEYDQTLNELLAQIDGLKVHDQVRILVIGATNRLDMLDKALLRPGRFDRIVQVQLPDREGRRQILAIHSQDKPLASDINLDQVASETFGFSGAHLESLLNEAAISALRSKRQTISADDVAEAAEKVLLGEKTPPRVTDAERRRLAYHETGHALLREKHAPGSVVSVTIMPRGQALGFLRSTEADRLLYTKDELRARIQTCMAGAVAEELVLHQRSTGAQHDIEQAVQTAANMVFAGLTHLGAISREAPAALYHRAITQIIAAEEQHVRDYLQSVESKLHAIAKQLLVRERLSGDSLRSLIAKPPQTKHPA